MDWHSVHVVYYEENKDALVLQAVRPLLDRLGSRVAAASYTRHWLRGPHLRLNLRCDPDTLATEVWPATEEIVGDFLARCPSRARLVPEEHLESHRRLAELERESGPLLPWHPDNSMHQAPFDRRVEVLGSPEAADLLADFYADSTEPAFRMTEQIVDGRQRASLAFDLMICVAHALSGVGIRTAFLSFRSHAEAFLATYPEGEGLRPEWEAHYRRHGAGLPGRVRQLVAALERGQRAPGVLDDWITLLRRYRRRARELLTAGRLSMDAPFTESPSAADEQPRLAEISPYHREAFANPAVVRSLTAEWFVLYRLLLNYNYLQLTRLGVTPMQRFLLCHLAANAVEELYGVSAMAKLREGPPEPASNQELEAEWTVDLSSESAPGKEPV